MIFLKVIFSSLIFKYQIMEKKIDSIDSIEKTLNTIKEGLLSGRMSLESLEPLLQKLSRPFGNQAYEQLGPYPLITENEEGNPVIVECWLISFWKILSHDEIFNFLESTDFRAADAEELKEFVVNNKRIVGKMKIAALSEIIWKKNVGIKCEYSYSYSKLRGMHLHLGRYDVDWKILVVKKT